MLDRKDAIDIGFQNLGPVTWQAGVVFLQNLFGALIETCRDEFSLSYVVTYNSELSPELSTIADRVITFIRPRRWTSGWAVDRFAARLLRYEYQYDRLLNEKGIQLIAFGETPSGSKLPMLGFIPDFQHVHLPEMFSESERRSRDVGYLKTIQHSSRLVLLSEAVRKDLEDFAGAYMYKTRVLKPVSYIPLSTYETDPAAFSKRFGLPPKFVYFPGQFWKHKNHIRAFQALKILKDQGVNPFLVCSGYPGDFRHPHYYSDMLTQLSELGIREQVALLGVLKREQTLTLMRQSLSVLNPSLFEGFGMTVDEARSVGKAAILSDIPPHREQNPPRAVYFDPSNAEDLAGKLRQIWLNNSPGPDCDLESQARSSLPSRRKVYAESFMSMVREVVP